MFSFLLLTNRFSSINIGLVTFGLLVIVALLRGKISPKMSIVLIFILGILGYFQQNSFFFSTITPPPQKFLNQEHLAVEPIPETEVNSNVGESKPKLVKKETPKYITTVQIEGIQNELFNQIFTSESGYTTSKKGDYIITFTETGSIRKGDLIDASRYIYSGGNLIVTVGSDKCCCNNLIKIPKDIPLGKSIKEGKEVLNQKIEESVLKNADAIVEMITECLPKI